MMVGYSPNSPEYLILDPRSGMIRTAYSVRFQEDVCGFTGMMKHEKETTGMGTQPPNASIQPSEGTPSSYGLSPSPTATVPETKTPPNTAQEPTGATPAAETDTHPATDQGPTGTGIAAVKEELQELDSELSGARKFDVEQNNQAGPYLCRSTRTRRQFDPSHMPSGTLEMARLTQQIEQDTSDEERQHDQLSPLNACMALQSEEDPIPRSWKQALNVPHWKEAMKNEVQELKAMQAWELVTRQPGMKVVPGLWRHRIKKDEGGVIQKYKARWVMDGSREPFKRPTEAIYSPVAEMATIRTLFALAAASGHQVLQADFRNAYLNAEMTEKIYTE